MASTSSTHHCFIKISSSLPQIKFLQHSYYYKFDISTGIFWGHNLEFWSHKTPLVTRPRYVQYATLTVTVTSDLLN